MNVVFSTNDSQKDFEVVKLAEQSGILGLKGHKLLGGLRASLYNAISLNDVEFLIEFLYKFEKDHS